MVRKRSGATGRFTKSVNLPDKVRKQLAAGKLEGRVDVGAYDVPKVSVGRPVWWRRWLGLGAATPAASQWDDLRHRVMDELKVRQGDDTSSKPFTRPLLPEVRVVKKPDWVFRGFVAASVAALVVLLVMGGRSHGPGEALHDVYEAWKHRDMVAMSKVVDMPAVATNVVGQVYDTPVLDPKLLPIEIKPEALTAGKDVAAMVKQGLADMLAEDMARAVVQGEVSGAGDSLLGSLWNDMGGSHVEVSKPRIVKIEGKRAEAELMLTRDDSHQLAEVVNVVLEERDGGWVVVGLPNFATVAARMNHVETQIAEAEAMMPDVEPAAGDVVRVSKLEKDTVRNGVMNLRVEVANTGNTPVKATVVKVLFADARGVPLRMIELKDTQPLAAGMRRVRTLPVPVTTKQMRWVAALPMNAMTVQTKVVAAN
ncbi:MAG: hypothetical protein WAZ18_06150 [Alphaproteobacteria bacterium]